MSSLIFTMFYVNIPWYGGTGSSLLLLRSCIVVLEMAVRLVMRRFEAMRKSGPLKMNIAVVILLRRFIIVPSMLLISVFCIWTFVGLVTFSVFSHSHTCTGQECMPLTRKGGQLDVLSRLKTLNLKVEQAISSLSKEYGIQDESITFTKGGAQHGRGINVARLERQDDEDLSSLERDADNLLLELKSMGFTENRKGDSFESARRQMIETEEEEEDEDDYEDSSGSNTAEGTVWDITQEDGNVIREGLHQIMQKLRKYSPVGAAAAAAPENESCSGRWIYSYDLPSKFNSDLVALCDNILPWYSMCDYFENSGMGQPVTTDSRGVLQPPGRWYVTNQYMLEVLFHARIKEYPCLTTDPSKAHLFHIPYYGGIDVFRYHYANVSFEQKDELGRELVMWLEQQPWWHRHSGKDHFLVLGKITWDFRRTDTEWGNTLLMYPPLDNVTRLLIERDPWNENEIGVPHPTYFHPASDSDIRTWLHTVRASHRDSLFSFAGMPRTTDTIRSILISICTSEQQLCRFLECTGDVCFKPESTMGLFLTSHFCLQPVGDSATRRSVFDSLLAGCIPVLFSELTAYVQYPWHLPEKLSSYSVFISSEDVKAGKVDVAKVLSGIPVQRRLRMREKIIKEVIPRLVYAAPGANLSRYEDAFQVSLRSLLEKSRHIYHDYNSST